MEDAPAQADRPFLLDHFARSRIRGSRPRCSTPCRILLLLLCATLAGADDVTEVGIWGGENLAFLRRLLPYRHGIPSHDTLGEVIAALDPALFKGCFACWVEGLRAAEPDIIAVDGKTSRRTHARGQGRGPLHLVSAWATRQRLVLGQEAVTGKSNEITAIPLLLERLALQGALVTIDAIGTQAEIADGHPAPRRRLPPGAEGEPPRHLREVEAFFADPPPGSLDTSETIDGDHGRTEVRRHAVCHDVGLAVLRPALPRRGRLSRSRHDRHGREQTERGGKVERERRYYLSSATLDAASFARAVRAHWGIENRLHWVLDVVFRDDLARLRTGHGPANMAVVRHMAMNLLHQARPTVSLKNRRKRAGWNTAYLESLIRQTA